MSPIENVPIRAFTKHIHNGLGLAAQAALARWLWRAVMISTLSGVSPAQSVSTTELGGIITPSDFCRADTHMR
jgi:hypothetical protein